MKQRTIEKVIRQLNKEIEFYQRKMLYQLELEEEYSLKNGNVESSNDFAEIQRGIIYFQTVLADIATIKRAVKAGKEEVKIFGIDNSKLSVEVENALKRAKLDYDFFDGILMFSSNEEMQENFWKDQKRTKGNLVEIPKIDFLLINVS